MKVSMGRFILINTECGRDILHDIGSFSPRIRERAYGTLISYINTIVLLHRENNN